MPSVNLGIDRTLGPILQAYILPTKYRIDALIKAKLPVPAAELGTFLLDTGASQTCVDPLIISKLGLTPTDFISIQTPSTNGVPAQCGTYDIGIIIGPTIAPSEVLNPILNMSYYCTLNVVEASLSHQGISGLIGRDILEQCILFYNGRVGGFTLSW
ncbi:MAG: hypothetical protein EVG15_08480 [Candidatus Acididesulfobacter diazotrophicus]|jgi:hypothetical protein|uniref:Peptidase A2 domain-containing protein n=1 Tax=Candidatus Acididesulfobacter diazotrophicus TaxID=2597226 RepID=A0A519BL42_9DELT|nr:MAG: hypothetical protein EVG15_08480 [Candidatus Acididesulfobacter diazotrophicus]